MSKTPSAKVMNVMGCAQARRWLQLRLDGERIPDRAGEGLRRHLAACRECRAWAADMESALAGLKTLREPSPSPRLKARLMRALGFAPVPRWLYWAAGAAAGLSAAWFVGVSLVSGRLLSVAGRAIPLMPRILRLGRHLLAARGNLAPYLSGLMETLGFFLAAFVLLVVLGVLSSRRLMRMRRLAPRSV